MEDRKYFAHKITELENIYENANGDCAILEELEEELSHRSTQKAKRLLARIEETLHGEVSTSTPEVKPKNEAKRANNADAGESIDWTTVISSAANRFVDIQPIPLQTLENNPEDILDAWTALEALSPQKYKTPSDLTIGQGSVAYLKQGREPWVKGEKSIPKNKLYYVAYLGGIYLDQATEELLKVYQDKRIERHNVNGIAALGAVILDQSGIPIPETGLALSSFGWAYGRALQGDLKSLKHWEAAEQALREKLEKIIYEEDEYGVIQPFSLKKMEVAYEYLVHNCIIPPQNTIKPSFATRLYQSMNRAEPEAPLLNSFFLDDLQRAKSLVENNSFNHSLSQYLGIEKPKYQYDLIADKCHIEKALQPKNTPIGRWPSKGRHSLVLLQQTAVNLAIKELENGGLFSVNGPPGTGKTTLLRDVVANVIVERAKSIHAFANTDDAFTHAGKIKVNGNFIHLYKLDDSLKGHEILVTSVNNNAVENISKELPQRSQIAEDLEGFSYFEHVSNAVTNDEFESWGLIAAALGNSKNRRSYINKAWWDNDSGLRHYFLSITGQYIPELDDNDEPIIPKVITECDPPENMEEAEKRWKNARLDFSQTLKRSEEAISKAQLVLEQSKVIIDTKPLIKGSEKLLEQLNHLKSEKEESKGLWSKKTHSIEKQYTEYKKQAKAIKQEKPWWITRIFLWQRWITWKEKDLFIKQKLNSCLTEHTKHKEHLDKIKIEIDEIETKLSKAKSDYTSLVRKYNRAIKNVEQYQHLCNEKLITSKLWELSHDEQQKFLPNFSSEVQRLRDDVFVSSIKLHKAFIDVSAKKIRQNLGAFFYCLAGNKLPDDKQALLPHLWSSHFLLTPVISTAFASVGRMLKDLPPESIGWLLIDEAGQAPPQAAIGAIYRSRRVISVGDPLQIEPIETLPTQLVETLSKYMGVDPDHWMAESASVQTLSDKANNYGTTIPRDISEIRIGAPLLVHRRCEDPMFTISNRMAYAGLMVHATIAKESSVTELFDNQVKWFHVEGGSEEKWCPEEGGKVIEMLEKICANSSENPDVFVISPFRIVADRMRQLANKQSHLFAKHGIENPQKSIVENIGTVHTFQGKEAKTVILLLGAPKVEQDGARGWATSNVNLLNVAISRAKQNFYVVGNRKLWGHLGHMKLINQRLR